MSQLSRWMTTHSGRKVPPTLQETIEAIMKRRLELRQAGLDFDRIRDRAARLGVDPFTGQPLPPPSSTLVGQVSPTQIEKPEKPRKQRPVAPVEVQSIYLDAQGNRAQVATYTAEDVLEAGAM
jgi:hypothetical protein